MRYPVETFTEAERDTLARHFTNADRPVFALVGLPETVKGALFARYSRYPGTLRRLFLEEFAGDIEAGAARTFEAEGERARKLYENVFLGYGDDSVAQLGGAHIAVEWCSNVMTKALQRGRLASYLEQSTRYIAYDRPIGDGSDSYRYWRSEDLGPEYTRAMDSLFDTYSQSIEPVMAWAAQRFPRADGQPEGAHLRSLRAKAYDLLRGLLPAASLSHVGMFGSGQAYEALLLRLMASPLPEARTYAEMILDALKATIPSFVARVERPDRGGEWIGYLERRAQAGRDASRRLGIEPTSGADGASVRLLSVRGSEQDLLAALVFESSAASETEIAEAVATMTADERAAAITELVGQRANRRHRPGRGFEALRYRFEVVSDYGAFRDLQRHRLLTVQWQDLTPDLGAGVPEELQEAGVADDYRRALDRSAAEYTRIADAGRPELASYALCLGYRIRYILDLDAREAMHLIELRSGREGHPAYRAVAHEMHALIADHHPAVAAAISHVDRETEPRLERILGEMRTDAKRAARI